MARLDSHRARTDYNLYAALDGRRRVGGRHRVRARARPPGERARGRPHARARSTTTSRRRTSAASVMDYPPPRVRLDANGQHRPVAGVRRRTGRVRRLGDSLGLRHLPGRRAKRDSLRAIVADGLAKRLPVSVRRGRAARVRVGSAGESVGRCRDADRVPESTRRRCAAWRCQKFGERNIRAGEPIALLQERFAAALLLPSLRAQRRCRRRSAEWSTQRRARRRAAGDAPDRRTSSRRTRCASCSPRCSPAELAIPTRCSR